MKTAVVVSLLALQVIQPGQMTQARVWVQNKGRAEAMPVDLREVNTDLPLNVLVVNGLPGNPQTAPVLTRLTRQTWEYDSVTVTAEQDPITVLNARGQAGWETTGVTLESPAGLRIVLKRPR